MKRKLQDSQLTFSWLQRLPKIGAFDISIRQMTSSAIPDVKSLLM